MHIYRGTLELLDYVFYATVERGKVYETGAFIHNYALAYAFGLAEGVPYAHLRQQPHYREELAPLNEVVYLTPAAPVRIGHRLVQWNTIREGYALAGKLPSLGYPDWGFARVLRPESVFVFYALVVDPPNVPVAPAFRDVLEGRVARIRLGKFPGKARVRLEPATAVKVNEGEFVAHTLLNWRDLTADPLVCDVLATSLPTRLLSNTYFDRGKYYEAHFGDDMVRLPAEMRFLARPPEVKRRTRRKR
jgi:CRISPR-associated protein Csc1